MINYTIINLGLVKWDLSLEEIIEIDAVKLPFDDKSCTFGEIKEKFATLVKPQYYDPQKTYDAVSFKLDGFSADDLKNAPSNTVALKRLREFIGDSKIITWDVDQSAFLFDCAQKHKVSFPNGIGDIEAMAQALFGDVKRRFSLFALARYFDLDFEIRRDAEILARVFMKLYDKQCGRDPKQQSAKDICFTPLYREILRDNESVDSTLFVFAESEIRVLQNANLGEAFMMLKDMIGELRKRSIAYRLNGAINMSYLAYCAGITDVKPNYTDDYISRLANPYRNSSLQAPSLCVGVDVESANEKIAVELMREYGRHYDTDRTLFAVQTAEETKTPETYEIAKQSNCSVLDVTVYPSEELTRFTSLQKSVVQPRKISDKDVFDYVQKAPIRTFDNAEKYLKVLQAIKPKNTNHITLAMAICESGRDDVLEGIIRFREDDRSLRPDGIAAVLYQSCGVFVYQEQAMRILCELSGCSQYFADNIRRAMTKRKIDEIEKYKQAFLFGGEDVYGMHFNGCAVNDKMVVGRNFWSEICEVMPKLFLKAHAYARAEFFIECAKLQMQNE